MFFPPDGRAIHDLIAGTKVVAARPPKAPVLTGRLGGVAALAVLFVVYAAGPLLAFRRWAAQGGAIGLFAGK